MRLALRAVPGFRRVLEVRLIDAPASPVLRSMIEDPVRSLS